MRNTLLLIAGFFYCSSVFGQFKKYSATQLNADLKYLAETIEEVHPNMYHDISKEDFKKLVAHISISFKDSMTSADAWPLFAKAIGAMNEGHTQIPWPEEFSKQLTENKLPYFPFFIKEFDGTSFIIETDASDENALRPGDRLTKINGRAVKEIVSQFKETVGGLPAWQETQIVRGIRTYLAMYNVRSPYEIEYVSNNVLKSATIQAQLRNRIIENRERRQTAATATSNYTYQNLDGIGYLNFISMADPKRFENFIDSVFNAIEKEQVTGLIVDLRQNGGGNSTLGVELLKRFTNKPFRMAGGVIWKVSKPYKDFYNSLTGEKRFMGATQEERYMNTPNGDVIEFKSGEPQKQSSDKMYTGKICFLIGPKTYSSANMLANAIKDYKLATLIGEATGEAPNDYGELISLKLPETGIQFFTSTKQFIRANGDAKDRNPIFPDIEIKDNPATTIDETLEFAKSFIKK